MAQEQSDVVVYPYIRNLALANGQFQHHPAQFCVSRCVCCGKVNVILVCVHAGRITKRFSESWQAISESEAPNLGGVFCPDCRPPGEDWEIVNSDGRTLTTIHRPGLATAQAYLDAHLTQYKDCTLRPRAPTP